MSEIQKAEAAVEKAINAAMTTGMFVIILFSVFVTTSIVANKLITPKKYEIISFSTIRDTIQNPDLTARDIALASVSERDLINE